MNIFKIFLILFSFSFISANAATTPTYGGQSMVDNLTRVLVRQPDPSFGNADPKKWHYTSQPNLKEALKEHDYLVKILQKENVDVEYSNTKLDNKADAIFVHDPAIITDHGAIILKMGKDLRRGEEENLKNKFISLGIPILAELSGEATAEGGDMLWVDYKTLAIGKGFRTNQAGIDQIRTSLAPFNVEVLQFDLPYDQGREACLHLQSLVSLISHDKALVYKKLAPTAFIELLESKKFTLLELPESEYASMGCNVLAIKPNICLALEGNKKTKELLEKNGVKVYTYKGTELSSKAEGGPTCLTRPILRIKS